MNPQASCTNWYSASLSRLHAFAGQRTVIRVPICTSDAAISRKILGFSLASFEYDPMRLTPFVDQVSPLLRQRKRHGEDSL